VPVTEELAEHDGIERREHREARLELDAIGHTSAHIDGLEGPLVHPAALSEHRRVLE